MRQCKTYSWTNWMHSQARSVKLVTDNKGRLVLTLEVKELRNSCNQREWFWRVKDHAEKGLYSGFSRSRLEAMNQGEHYGRKELFERMINSRT